MDGISVAGVKTCLPLGLTLLLAGCATLDIGIERTPTPDYAAIGTLAALMAEGTRSASQYEEILAEYSREVTPTPSTGMASGAICYPGDAIPAMTIYFRDTRSSQVYEIETRERQDDYAYELPPGEYYAFAWVDRYMVGGMYTYAVPCGLGEECIDHRPLPFVVPAGQTARSIDICDWVFAPEALPFPAQPSSPENSRQEDRFQRTPPVEQ
jgi:hypothetical protein